MALTVEKMMELLREGDFGLFHDSYTNSEGAGFLLMRSARTLREWRERGCGPRALQLEKTGTVYYDLEDLAAYIEEQKTAADRRRAADGGKLRHGQRAADLK